MQYSRKLGQNSPYLSPYPLSSPHRRPAVALGQPWAPPAPARHRRPGLPPPCCCPCPAPPRKRYCPRRRARCGFGSPKIFLGAKIFEGVPRFGPRKRVTGSKNSGRDTMAVTSPGWRAPYWQRQQNGGRLQFVSNSCFAGADKTSRRDLVEINKIVKRPSCQGRQNGGMS